VIYRACWRGAQEVYEQLKAREEKVRRAEAQLAEAETEGLRRLRAREGGIEASLSARKARLDQQVQPCPLAHFASLACLWLLCVAACRALHRVRKYHWFALPSFPCFMCSLLPWQIVNGDTPHQ